MSASKLAPVLFIPHGGGPLPLLGDPDHRSLTDFLGAVSRHYAPPKAILVISAHWEAPQPTILGDPRPDLYFDYYGFPPETYRYRYPAENPAAMRETVRQALSAGGFDAEEAPGRGYDHGVFVPLLLMQSDAAIPVLQVSLSSSLDPNRHLALGRALAPLRRDGVMILGSGLSFHNMRLLRGGESGASGASQRFHDWLVASLTDPDLGAEGRYDRLARWTQAPESRVCHPREEHLLPLHVCVGAAEGEPGRIVFDEPLMGHRTIGALWR